MRSYLPGTGSHSLYYAAVYCRLLIYEFSCRSVIVKSNIYSAAIPIISSLQTIIFITRTCVFAKLSTSALRPGVRTTHNPAEIL